MRVLFVVLVLGLGSLAAADWQEAVNLGRVVNTGSGEWYPMLPEDGSYMIFVSDRTGGYGQTDLYISYRIGGEWQEPQNMGPNVNSSTMESAPSIAYGDSVLYFASFAAGGQGGMDIWYCPLENGVAGPKVNMGSEINGGALDCCPVLSPDGMSFYICSDRAGGFGEMDVWGFDWEGEGWGPAYNLGRDVNSAATDCPRWITADGHTLLLSTTRSGGLGSSDLWYTEWSGTAWRPVVNLGPPINSSAEEWGPDFLDNAGAVGGVIYFGSSRSGGQGGRDIWFSREETSDVETEPSAGGTLRAFPNPQSTTTCVTYELDRPAEVALRIFGLQGRLIRTLVDRHQRAGAHAIEWDGAADDGTQVAEGVYFCEMRIGEKREGTRWVVARR